MRITVYILTPSEFCQTRVHKSLIREALPDTLSFFLTGIRLGPKQGRRVNDSTASLSPARTMDDYSFLKQERNNCNSFCLFVLFLAPLFWFSLTNSRVKSYAGA